MTGKVISSSTSYPAGVSKKNPVNEWEKLPSQAVKRVFSFLPWQETVQGKFICRSWRLVLLPVQIKKYLEKPGYNIVHAVGVVAAYLRQPGFDVDQAVVLAEKFVHAPTREWILGDIVTAYIRVTRFDLNVGTAVADRMTDRDRTSRRVVTTYVQQPDFDLYSALSPAEKISHPLIQSETFYRIIEAYIKQPEFDITIAIAICEKISDKGWKTTSINDIVEAYLKRPDFDVKLLTKRGEQVISNESYLLLQIIRAYTGQKEFDVATATQLLKRVPPSQEVDKLLSDIKSLSDRKIGL